MPRHMLLEFGEPGGVVEHIDAHDASVMSVVGFVY